MNLPDEHVFDDESRRRALPAPPPSARPAGLLWVGIIGMLVCLTTIIILLVPHQLNMHRHRPPPGAKHGLPFQLIKHGVKLAAWAGVAAIAFLAFLILTLVGIKRWLKTTEESKGQEPNRERDDRFRESITKDAPLGTTFSVSPVPLSAGPRVGANGSGSGAANVFAFGLAGTLISSAGILVLLFAIRIPEADEEFLFILGGLCAAGLLVSLTLVFIAVRLRAPREVHRGEPPAS